MSAVTAVIGLQFGDEGKGKIIDAIAKDYDFIIRYQGGDNAGHTIKLDDGKEIIFHLIPSGVLYENKTGVIGHGVVFNPASFIEELNNLKKLRFNPNIYISKNAHIIMPYHIYLDEANDYIGTTRKGIGPAYVDKVARCGIKIEDIFDEEKFKKKLEFNLKEKEHILKNRFSKEDILKEYIDYGRILSPYVKDTVKLLHQALQKNKSMLFEGAQGTLLDINYGIYPYVTSSDCSIGGVGTGTGISPRSIGTVIGVMKSYTTRVGEGPLFTEENCSISEQLKELGNEYGATTGRPRRCGWLDLVAIKYAIEINDIDYLAVTKLDVLSKFENIKVCIDYKYDYKYIKYIDHKYKDIMFDSLLPIYDNLVKPEYLNLEGWMCDISDRKKYEDLPKQLKEYIELIEWKAQRPVRILSVGARRSQTIWHNQLKAVK